MKLGIRITFAEEAESDRHIQWIEINLLSATDNRIECLRDLSLRDALVVEAISSHIVVMNQAIRDVMNRGGLAKATAIMLGF